MAGRPPGPHNFFRGGPPAFYDDETRQAIQELDGRIDSGAVGRSVGTRACFFMAAPARQGAWRRRVRKPVGQGRPARRGHRLRVVGRRRSRLRPLHRLDIPETTRAATPSAPRCRSTMPPGERGRGWTLWKALITLARHVDTNPQHAATARRVIDAVLADHKRNASRSVARLPQAWQLKRPDRVRPRQCALDVRHITKVGRWIAGAWPKLRLSNGMSNSPSGAPQRLWRLAKCGGRRGACGQGRRSRRPRRCGQRGVAGLDRGPGGLQAQALHGLGRRRPGLGREGPGEVARAHGGAVGQALDGQRLGEVRAHPLDQRREAARPPAQLHQGRELRLAAGPPLVNDELLRRPAGDLAGRGRPR